MELGKQYKPDDDFKAAARLHQSKYRAEVLQVKDDEYGNRLNDNDSRALVNYYEKLDVRKILREKFPQYSKERDSDMLRSEHIPFNLIAPLNANRQVATDILNRAFGVNCEAILSIEIEYAPKPKGEYLNDATAFDSYIKIIKTNGNKCGIGIEVKYTEQAYKIGETEKRNIDNKDSLYWNIARSSNAFIDPNHELFGTDSLRQIWRNHLLGLSMLKHEKDDIVEFYSITLFPEGNSHFQKELLRYISLLNDTEKSHVIGCTFEKFISAIGGTPDFVEWKEWLEQRYVVK